MKTTLGIFSKAIGTARSLNFSQSASKNCDRACRYHEHSTAKNKIGGCYAFVKENRYDRKQLKEKLERHQASNPVLIVNQAILELQKLRRRGESVDWFRLSTNGSLPNNPTKALLEALRRLFRELELCGCSREKVHFPLESAEKVAKYRELLGVVTIRESVQSDNFAYRSESSCSFVIGHDIQSGKDITKRRASAARAFAKLRYESTGRKTIVCPAVTSSWQAKYNGREDRIKCGQCTACANPCIDVVYPYHGPKLIGIGGKHATT